MPRFSGKEVFIIKTSDRAMGIRKLMSRFRLGEYAGGNVALKANFNSADPFPASTHLDTLQAIIGVLKEAHANGLTLAERSGMGETRRVLEYLGVFKLMEKLGFKVVVLDELDKEGWVKIDREGTHWPRGFYIAKLFLEADKVIQTCCLKTHRFGGHFTLSLKNSVGLIAQRVPGGLYDYMRELHGSPYQRQMIAEINKFYPVDLVIMDGTKAFVIGGPDKGELVEPNLLLASRDRVAIDAVGVALLKIYGAKENLTEESIFKLDQLRRATELGFGAKSASEIHLISLNSGSRDITEKVKNILSAEGKTALSSNLH